VVERALLTPANVVRGLPVKTAAALAAKPSPYGKLGFRNFWPPEYTKPYNPRMQPFAYTLTAKIRATPWQFIWEYQPVFRMFIYAAIITGFFMFWLDRKVWFQPHVNEAMVAMFMDDLNEQRRVLYTHTQKHHDHAYFRDKGCHDGHPLGHGVTDPHVL